MKPARALQRIVRASARRPGRVIAAVAAVAAVCAALALTLDPSAATDTLVDRSSDSYAATERYRERFGEQSVIVLVRGDVSNLVLTKNLNTLVGLEGCLSGNKPADAPAPGGERSPCAALARTKPVKVVYGPGTFVNSAVGEIQQQLSLRSQQTAQRAQRAGRAARRVARGQGRSRAAQDKAAKAAEQVVYAELLKELLQINLKYGLGLTGAPQLNDPNFVSALVFDPSRGAGTPKARFAYLFPNRGSSVIQVRLKETLTDAQRRDAIARIRAAVAMPQWRLDKASYTVTGAPVVLDDLADALAGSVLRLLVVALIVMAIVLALVFRSRLRIVPLLVALAAVAMTFGAMALLGAPLTMASIAVLPVLLGLGVDYAIQFQARVEEEDGDAEAAARLSGPTIATAALATAVGFLVLQLSPVPMVRGFGALLVAGIVLALLLAFSAGTAALALQLRRRREGPLASSLRGAGELADAARDALARPAARAGAAGAAVLRGALRRPGRVLALGLALAAVGWALDSQTEVVSDVERLVPQDLTAVRDIQTLQRTTGVAGEVDVIVEGKDLTDPKVVRWMRDYQSGLLEKYGYSSTNGCGKAELCPALSLTDLFRDEKAASSREQVRGAAGRRAAVLLAVRHHGGPPDREPRLRRAADAARPPAGDLRGHARAAEAARRGDRRAGRSARARGGRQRHALGSAAPARDAAGRPARRRARPAGRLPPLGARAHPARADRAGDGLVGARAVRDPDPAQPDVGDPERARDRDLDRVLGAADRPLSGGARGGARAGRGAAGDVRLDRRRGARLGRDRDRRLRGARVLRRRDAARLRHRDRGRPHRVAARGARRPAGRPDAGRAARRAPRSRRSGAARGRPGLARTGRPRVSDPAHPARSASASAARSRRRGRPPQPPPPAPPARRSTVTWIVGVAVVLAFAYITLNTIRTDAPGSRGLDPGDPLPPFAAPLALSSLDGDANLATEPGQGGQGDRPACEVRGPDVLNSCQLAERGPVVIAFVAARSDACDRQIDVLDRVRADYPDIAFAAVAIRGDREELRRTIRRRGWSLPVAWDRDGGVANAYAVAICPTVTFAYAGGKVEGTSLSLIDGVALRSRLEKLRRGQ